MVTSVVPSIPPASVPFQDYQSPDTFSLPWRKFFQYLSTISAASPTPADVAALTALAAEALANSVSAEATASAALAAALAAGDQNAIAAFLSLAFDTPPTPLSVLLLLAVANIDLASQKVSLTSGVTGILGPTHGGSGVANTKNLAWSNSLTFAGTDATTISFPTTSATMARTDAAQSFTGQQTFGGNIKVSGDTTGAGTVAGFGVNSPAVTLTGPYTWLKFISSDGSTVYVPAYK